MENLNEQFTRRKFLKEATQATASVAASAGIGSAAVPLLARAGEAGRLPGPRISYYCNGEIHVNEVGKPERKPLTTGHWDFKPSWSKTGNKLVFFRRYKDPGRTLYIADFGAAKRTITNLKAIANQSGWPFWYAYPRWIEGEAAIVYHMMNQTGKGQLFVYRLEDGSTKRVSTNEGADYRYPHGEATPC